MFSLSTLALSLLAAITPAQRSNLTVALCNAGEHQQFEAVTCDIELRNTGDKPIRISNARALIHWDDIQQVVVVPSRGTAYLRATVRVNDSVGFVHRAFQFTTDEPGVLAQRGAEVQLFSSTILDQSAPAIDFSMVELEDLPLAKSITLTSREVPNFRILGILSKPEYVDASLAEDGRTVRASIRKGAPWGLLHEQIKLKINTPQQPEAWIKLNANVQGDVVPDSNPFPLGFMRTNNKNEFLIRLTSRTGKNFKIGALTLQGIKGRAKAIPCKPTAGGCRLVQMIIAKDQMQGRVGGVLSVELPEFNHTLPIQLGGGLLLAPEVKIRDMDKEGEKAREEHGKAQSTVDVPTQQNNVDVKQVIKQAIQKKDEATPPPGKGPLLRWSVANQNSVHGYIIYRAAAEAGPFLRVNTAIISAVDDDSAMSGAYQWRDNSTESGKTYWYSIGMVKDDGEKVALTGAQKVEAK